jgi:hypothetical protein
MNLTIELLTWLQETPLAQYIRESEWAFPTIESLHVIALTIVFGTIAVVDLRLCGLASTNRRFTEIADELLPWTWGAFVLAVIFGSLLFTSHALIYFNNTAFRLKFIFMFFAAVNMLVFELVVRRGVSQWNVGKKIPWPARLAGVLSLIFWTASVYLGRQTGWTMDAF